MPPHVPADQPTVRQLVAIAVAITAIAALRVVFGPFALQGVLWVVVTAVVAWRIGPRTGVLSALLGIVASHVLRFIGNPSSLLHPSTFMNRQYAAGMSMYVLLSTMALLVGRRHRSTVQQLESTRRDKEQDDRAHREQLEAAVTRERAARLDAERANEVREQLLQRMIALSAASGVLLRSPRVEDVVPAILAVARDLLPADAYAVWRREVHSGDWHIEASDGISAAFEGAGIPDRAAAQLHEPLAVPDVTTPPMLEDRRRAYQAEGIRSVLIVPILTRGQATGAMVFYYRTRHAFAEPEMLAARAFGNLASAALTTAELYDRQQRSRTESEFLADAGALLANSLDYRSTLTQVARMAVPLFADLCVVDLVDESGAIVPLTAHHADPARAEGLQEFRRRSLDDPESPVARAIRTRMPVLVESVSEETTRVEAPGIGSFMVVPLVARERGAGAITFGLDAGSRRYSSEDLRFATSVASRAALAVDNAAAYEEATRASRLKDEFLATLSHELRTPLNAVVGYARMANSGMLQGERLSRALHTLERNASTLTRLVEDVLDVSRFMTGKVQLTLQQVDVATVVDQAVLSLRPTAQAKGVQLTRRPGGQPPPVHGDPDRLQQVTWNLVSNAVKFTPRGGAVEVEVAADDGHVEIVVRDTGAGITPEFMPHVFERFRQGDGRFAREHGGLGLGLAIARDLVQLHGGTIAATSGGPGQGAEFRVRVPLMVPSADAAIESTGGAAI